MVLLAPPQVRHQRVYLTVVADVHGGALNDAEAAAMFVAAWIDSGDLSLKGDLYRCRIAEVDDSTGAEADHVDRTEQLQAELEACGEFMRGRDEVDG
jgi:hypothetical protein